ncbi:hypothetical protein [Streptomyces violascens]|uniref:hypothetical protein n=1 Tax=Streptomyces violascens TaxID=67381 RepID=UPI003650CD45
MWAKPGGLNLIAQRNGDARICVYIGFRGPLDWQAGIDVADTEAVRARLLGMYEGFDESLLDLMRLNDCEFSTCPVLVLPVPHTWKRVPGVTLFGDAAHLMPRSASAPTWPPWTAPNSSGPSSTTLVSRTRSPRTRTPCCPAPSSRPAPPGPSSRP